MLLSKSLLTAPFILCCGCFERHLLGPWTLVPCVYLDLSRNNKSNNHVAQTHLPTTAGLTGPAGRARAQQAPVHTGHGSGDRAGAACPELMPV